MSEQANMLVRLACVECDRDDCDGVSVDLACRNGWEDIGEDLCKHEVPPEGFIGSCWDADPEPGHWWTHLGRCPDCVSKGDSDE